MNQPPASSGDAQVPSDPYEPYGEQLYGTQPYGTPPYGGQTPYGGQPYGAAPYGAPPYGAPPYGAPPYGGQPYGAYPPGAYGQPPYPGYGFVQSVGTNGMAIASMVLGILWLYWIGSILALIFGYIARSQIKRTNQQGGGMAVAGIVLGWIGVAALVAVIVTVIVATNSDSSCSTDSYGYSTC